MLIAAALTATPNPALTGFPVAFEASPPQAQVARVDWDFEGDGLYDVTSGTELRTEGYYADPGEYAPVVRFTEPDGRETTAGGAITVRRSPPFGEVGALLDGGRRFTNDRSVRVGLVWPPYTVAVELSRDPAFAVSETVPVRASVDYDLDTTRRDGMPQTVYARFSGGEATTAAYSDDIVLDRTRPTVEAYGVRRTTHRRWRLRLLAYDATAGIRSLQVTERRSRPGLWEAYRPRPVVRTLASRVFVRVRDRARNASRWVSVILRDD